MPQTVNQAGTLAMGHNMSPGAERSKTKTKTNKNLWQPVTAIICVTELQARFPSLEVEHQPKEKKHFTGF